MKRITPEEVLEAFVSQELTPMQGAYFQKDGCACGLGAMAKKMGMVTYYTPEKYSGRETGKKLSEYYGVNYHDGFARGFDNQGIDGFGEAYSKGYEDGLAAWEAVSHLAVSP